MEFRNGDEAAMGLGDNGNAATLEADTPATAKAVKMDRKDAGSDDLVAEAAAQVMTASAIAPVIT
jgi:ribonucleoside-diphosphate reductase alpha chain